eukprot:TRINITY_DN19824_c0_g1_i3.p1 TRINITY_DN19824_c0_g1~~TRINITY_DN19824_c0_g1_i3.p1  ORF type:complete len:280 (-),score=30.40 TRINITY_DN19824_c0_g1_i3:112-951(-)
MNLEEEQAAVYDRQIRLWGSSVQKRLSQSHVLIQGQGDLLAEVAKNLALAGVGEIFIYSNQRQTYLSQWSNSQDPAQQTVDSLQRLNPFISVKALQSRNSNYSQVDYVICVNQSLLDVQKIQTTAQTDNCGFVACGCWGGCGFMFSDYNDLNYEQPQSGRLLLVLAEFERETGRSAMEENMTTEDEQTLTTIASNCFPEESQPIFRYLSLGCQQIVNGSNAALNSIMGGMLANGVIKQLGDQAKDARIEFVVYDPFDQVAWVQPVQKQIGRRKLKVRRG